MQITFTIRTADGTQQRRTVATGTYLLGREPDCDVVLESSDVSRHHARLILGEKDFQVVDLGSTLGSKLNGQPLAGPQRVAYPGMLQLGSVNIHLGSSTEEAHLQPEFDDAAPPAADPDARVPYVFGGQIARGGMGSILEAEDCKIGRKVAVKIMLSDAEADDYQKQRFIHEAAVLGRLEHPNIVPVHDIGRDAAGQLYYSMKLVKGRTLQAILNGIRDGGESGGSSLPTSSGQDRGKMPLPHYTLDRLLTIFRKVCDAMAFAHSRAIIHRDLKPENIMVGEFGEVLVMDWGLAKFLNDPVQVALQTVATGWESTVENFGMTLEGTVMGTPQYMSPEQAEGRVNEFDARSDIYALGGILYAILTLRPPIEGRTLNEVLQKVASGSITPLTTVGRARRLPPSGETAGGAPALHSIPAALAAVTMKALSVKRELRYPNVAALSADVEAYQNGFATTAEQAGAWKQFTLFVKRHKAASLGIVAVLLIGSTLGTQAFIEGKRATQALADLKKSAPALLKLGESEADTQHFGEALHDMDAALALDPALIRARWQRAWALLGMEEWTAAAEALRLAQQNDPSSAQLASILPVCDALAAAPDDAARFTPGNTEAIFKYLSNVGASGELLAISKHLVLGAQQKQLLVRQRLDVWIGKNVGNAIVLTDGTIQVKNLPKTIDTLEPLRGLRLGAIECQGAQVKSLEPLRGMALTSIVFSGTPIADLSPLQGMPLMTLTGANSDVSDLSPLAGMPLHYLALTATKIHDLTPLRGAPLEVINLTNCKIVNFSPLRGAPLKDVQIISTQCSDISFLTDAPLQALVCTDNFISDLTPLRGRPLKFLATARNPLTDLRPLAGLPLTELDVTDCPIIDYAPVLNLHQLEKLRLSPSKYLKGSIEPLRQARTLQYIAFGNVGPYRPTAEFWADYDKQQAAQKK